MHDRQASAALRNRNHPHLLLKKGLFPRFGPVLYELIGETALAE